MIERLEKDYFGTKLAITMKVRDIMKIYFGLDFDYFLNYNLHEQIDLMYRIGYTDNNVSYKLMFDARKAYRDLRMVAIYEKQI